MIFLTCFCFKFKLCFLFFSCILSRQCLNMQCFDPFQSRIHGWDSSHCQGHWKIVQTREIVALYGTAVLLVHSFRSTTTVSSFLKVYLKGHDDICCTIFRPLNPLGSRFEIQLTITWIKTHLEEDQQVSLPKHEVYDDYL